MLLLPQPTHVIPLPGRHSVPARRTCRGWSVGSVSPTIERDLGLMPAHAEAWVQWHVDAGQPAGGYSVRITPEAPILVHAAGVPGLRHALATIAQLVREHGAALPCCEIRDRPAFATRGVMLDVSRDRIPTMAHFHEIIDLLAALKFNHLQLYTEHTFAYRGHEDVWRDWSPLTPEEIRVLDAYAGARGIELAANQNCFGHMVPWLKLPRYAPLAETHGDWMFDIWPRSGPFSLCPTDPASLALVEDLLGQLLPCFTCPHVNIGCDEVYDIAYGRSKGEVERRGRPAVYMEFVNKIASVVRRHGKRAQFWGDIALSHPECVKEIPADVLPLAWGYEPESPFERWGEMLTADSRGASRDFWVCPGTSTWRTLTGRTTERRGNIKAAAAAGVKYGASGFLVCDWGDSGHQQQWPLTMHALADAAQAAWNPKADGNPLAESLHIFGDAAGDTPRWLDALGDADLPLREVCGALSHPTRTRLLNQTAIFIDMFKQLEEQRQVGSVELWRDTHDRLDHLAGTCPATAASRLIRDELTHTARYARAAALRGVARRNGEEDLLAALPLELTDIAGEHARLWRLRSREGGLAHSLTYFQQVLDTFAARTASGVTLFE